MKFIGGIYFILSLQLPLWALAQETEETAPMEAPYPAPTKSAKPSQPPPQKSEFSSTKFDTPPAPKSPMYSNDGLMKITKKGEYLYKVEESPQDHAASLRFGSFSSPNLMNPDNGITFQDIYGGSSPFLVLFDYEWQLLKSVGKLGLKLGSGFMTATGNGRFKSPSRQSEKAFEIYTFYLFPNNLSAVYRAQYWSKQFLVPYAEAGLDYFTFAELRDDGAGTKYGGSPAAHVAFGGSLTLDFLDKTSVFELDNDYGINHVWLTAEYRIIKGGGKFDFSSNVFNAGVLVEF